MFKSVALLCCAPTAFAFSIHLFPAKEFTKSPAEELPGKMGIAELVIEDFEDEQLVQGLRTTLAKSREPVSAPLAWDGESASDYAASALIEFDGPGVRFFGIGVGDNDGGNETLSINGGWHVNLNSFPSHAANGQGKSYYLVVVAGANDPDLRTISIANGFTIVFDQLVFSRGAATPKPPEQALPEIYRNVGLRSMAHRIQQRQRSVNTPAPTIARREGELIVNGGFDQVGPANGDDERGQFGETMFSPGSTRLKGWTILNSVVGLRDNPPSPAGGVIMELGPRNEPGAISQKVKTEAGKEYELSFLASGGRNNEIMVTVAGKGQAIQCPEHSRFERVKIPFRAVSSETEVVISAIGNEGFGPMIDDASLVQLKTK